MDDADDCAKHILIVDDDITCLDMVSFAFQQSGYSVFRCISGESAVEYVHNIVPDLILIDILMPGLDGLSTVRSIRSLGIEQVPIIAFTGVDDEDLNQAALEVGCQLVLRKPCPLNTLIAAISNSLATRPEIDPILEGP